MDEHVNNGEKGFSLVELSIVLVVISLLIGGIIGSAGSFINLARSRETEKQLEITRDAIIGFAIQNGRLPCADSDGDGLENGPPTCAQWGTLPFATLAVERKDPWGGDYRYRVDTNFADAPAGGVESSFSLTDSGNITVKDSADPVANTVAVDIPVIVVSEGPNRGNGSDDENENIDDDNNFVQREYSNTSGSSFDDKLMWISPLVLKAKMLEVGKLP